MIASDANGTPLNVKVESASTYEGHVAEKTIDGKDQKTWNTS